MKNTLFTITPIGGVGEIGSNHTLLRHAGGDIYIDCGLLFPYEDFFDIDYLIPDFSEIDGNRLQAMVITHGHEDHIGALTHFLELFPNTPVYAGPFTQKLIMRKCSEKGIKPRFVEYQESDILDFGEVQIHPIHVTHSIPETYGLFILDSTKHWGAFWVSDFKVDFHPTDEAPFNIEKLKSLASSCQKTAFFIDSTNALVKGKTPSETELLPGLDSIISGDQQRIFMTLFSSNVHRMGRLIQMAKKHGRRVVLMGRSVENYVRAGIEAGILNLTEADFLLPAQAKNAEGRLLVIVSGCQGDFLSALRRLSDGEDGTFKLQNGDRVVFSSKVIPGNEKKISRLINGVVEAGADVVTAYDALIHASGHPGQEDLQILASHVRPDVWFPIHGESFFLRRHCDWAREKLGLSSAMIMNGHTVGFFPDGSWKVAAGPASEPVIIHGKGIPIERTQISQRRKLATQGSVFVSLDRIRGQCIVTALGLPLSARDCLPQVRKLILEKVKDDLHHRAEDYASDQIRIMVRQFYQQALGYKPVTDVHLLN